MHINQPAPMGPGMGPLALQQRRTPQSTLPLSPGVPTPWRPLPAMQLGQVGGFMEFWTGIGIAADLLRL